MVSAEVVEWWKGAVFNFFYFVMLMTELRIYLYGIWMACLKLAVLSRLHSTDHILGVVVCYNQVVVPVC